MEKRSTQAGDWIQFDLAVSDPVICTGSYLTGDKDILYSRNATPKCTHSNNLHNDEKDEIIRLCRYSKKHPGHLVCVGHEKEHQIERSQP
jgi:hypothetical protein